MVRAKRAFWSLQFCFFCDFAEEFRNTSGGHDAHFGDKRYGWLQGLSRRDG